MVPAAETPLPRLSRPRAPLWARALPLSLAWRFAKILTGLSTPGFDGVLESSSPPSPPLRNRARKVEIAGRAWLRLGNRLDPRWICRRGEILGLEHRRQAEAGGARVVYGVLPEGREKLAASLLALFDPPIVCEGEPSSDPLAAQVAAAPRAIAAVSEGTVVLPTLVWVEPAGNPRVRIAAPLAHLESGTEPTALLAPFATTFEEHPDAWPWHRLAAPPWLASDR